MNKGRSLSALRPFLRHDEVFQPACNFLASVEFHEAGSDVVGFIQRKDKYSPIADLSSLSGLDDEFNDIVDFIIVCDDIDHHFGQQWLLIFHAAIDDRVSLLTSESFNIQDGHPLGDGLKRRDYII